MKKVYLQGLAVVLVVVAIVSVIWSPFGDRDASDVSEKDPTGESSERTMSSSVRQRSDSEGRSEEERGIHLPEPEHLAFKEDLKQLRVIRKDLQRAYQETRDVLRAQGGPTMAQELQKLEKGHEAEIKEVEGQIAAIKEALEVGF